MKTKRAKFELFRAIFASVAVAVFSLTSSAHAQETAQNPAAPPPGTATTNASATASGNTEASAERVIVTGSNIPTAEEVGPNPVLTVNRELIDKSGERTSEELLRNLPVANANGVPVSNNENGTNSAVGAATIALRGFDSRATLILLDGRRVAPYPVGNNPGVNVGVMFVDLNSIPQAAIESIEILKDGASTTYGADAVAGVVNIKFRKEYRGAEASIEYGNTLDKDSGEFAASMIFGVGDGNTNVSGVLNFYHRNSIANRDRGFSAKPPFLSSNASPYNLQVSRAGVLPAVGQPADPIPNLNPTNNPAFFTTAPDGQQVLNAAGLALVGSGGTGPNDAAHLAPIPGVNKLTRIVDDRGTASTADDISEGFAVNNTFFASAPFFTNGSAPASTYTYSQGRSNKFNFNQFSLSFSESERYGGYVNFDHKVCGDQLVIYGDMFYENAKVHSELAAPATGSFQTKGQTTLAIPPNSPIAPGAEPPNTPTHAETGVPADAFNPFNPFQQIISGGARARLAEFGNRLFDRETDAFLTTLGMKGDKLFDGNWGYDTAFRYSQVKNTLTGTQVSITRFNRIVNQADPIYDPTSPEFIGSTVAFNPFGDYRVPIASNAASLGFATIHPKDIDTSKLATLDATMYTTELFNLPAGGVGLAFGGQFRRETLDESPDASSIAGDVAGNSPVFAARGGRKSFAFYAETDIPIFSPSNAIPGFHALEFTAAGRFEDFRNNDTNVLVPKVGLRWQPIDDTLTLRATWGEGFREPSLEELFAAPISTLEISHDPQNGGLLESETNVLVTSNPNLQPEDSRAFTAGIVYTPKYVPGLTTSVDFWDIERTGVVASPTADQVLAREAAGALLPGEGVERDQGGFITRILKSNQNLGAQTARGVDFGVQYEKQTPWGTFTSLTQATYLYEFFFPQFAEGNLAGHTTDEGLSNEGYYEWKGDSRVDWAWNGFDIISTVRFTDGFREHTPALREHWVHSTWVFDVQGSYDFTFAAPVENQPVAGYSKDPKEMVRGKDGKAVETGQTANYSMPCWKNLLNNSTITVGCNNVFGQDPPQAFGEGGNGVGYPGFTYDATGRFVYVRLTKKF